MTSKFYALAALLLCGCAASNLPARADDVTRVEAETKLAAGDAKVLDVAGASGGKAVSIARDWQPLLIAPVPEKGDAFTIWVRYRDKPVLVKADLPDGQKDLGWIWDAPKELTWKRAGRFSRDKIGKNLIVIRGGDGGAGPVLDALVFAADDAYDPNADATTPAKAIAATDDEAAAKANLNEGAAVALGIKDAPDGRALRSRKLFVGNRNRRGRGERRQGGRERQRLAAAGLDSASQRGRCLESLGAAQGRAVHGQNQKRRPLELEQAGQIRVAGNRRVLGAKSWAGKT